jgi:hypothetical protein
MPRNRLEYEEAFDGARPLEDVLIHRGDPENTERRYEKSVFSL